MRGIIVDDEAKSRRTLKALCEDYCKDIEIVGLAASVSEARGLVEQFEPDLVFLDIQMPVQNGFALMQGYKETIPFQIIFTTAYDQYALKAFQYAAVDYLLKPIDIEELILAVEKAKENKNLAQTSEKMLILREMLKSKKNDKIALTTMDSLNFVKFDDIVRCEAQGNYTSVRLKDGRSLLITKTLKYYEEILLEKNFFRVHKSHLINLKYVRKFIKGKQGLIEMTDGKQIEVSFRKRQGLLEQLSSSR